MMIEQHATYRGDEVSFPKWVQVLSWVVGLCFPMAIIVGGWMGSTMIDLKIEVANLRGQMVVATEDRYRASQAEAAHLFLQSQITQSEEDIKELQRLHGRE